MAKMYYSLEETLERLGCSEEELRNKVQAGKLREFRDAGKLNYRVEEVDRLAGSDAGSAASDDTTEPELADTGELTLADDDSDSEASGGKDEAAAVSLSDSGTGAPLALSDSGTGAPLDLSGSDAPLTLSDSGGDEPLQLDSSSGTGAPAPAGSGAGKPAPKVSGSGSDLDLGGSDLAGSGGGTGLGMADEEGAAREKQDKSGTGSGSGLALSLSDSGSGELSLEDSSAESGEGQDVLSLDEVDKDAVEGMKKDDTVITNIGISVFDDDDLEIAADPMAKTLLTGGDEHLGLDGSGGGSGLLDLTRESDDTSLGAELLEGIDMGDTAETVSPVATQEEGEPTAAPEAEAAEEGVGPEEDLERVGAAVVAAPAGFVEPVSPAFTGLLMAAVLVLVVAGATSMANGLEAWPGYLGLLAENFWFFLVGALGLGGIFAAVGWFIGRPPSAPKKPKPPKPKKEPRAKKKGRKGKGSGAEATA